MVKDLSSESEEEKTVGKGPSNCSISVFRGNSNVADLFVKTKTAGVYALLTSMRVRIRIGVLDPDCNW